MDNVRKLMHLLSTYSIPVIIPICFLLVFAIRLVTGKIITSQLELDFIALVFGIWLGRGSIWITKRVKRKK